MSLISSSKPWEGDALGPTLGPSTPVLEHSRAWLLAGLAAVLLRGLPDLRYPMGVDQAIYSIVGQGLLHGQLPYRDLWDIKPPGIYYIYALVVKIFGPVMWSVGVVDILWLLAISLCIFYFARPCVGAPAAALAMVFNAVRHCRIGYNNAAQAESFLMLCVFLAWFLLREGAPYSGDALAERTPLSPPDSRGSFLSTALRSLAAGLALGASVWLKYNAIVFFPIVLLAPFLDFRELDQGVSRIRMTISGRSWLVRMTFVAGGFVLVMAAVLGHFWAAGAWPAMKEAHFELLARYGATAFHWERTYLVWALRSTQYSVGLWTEVMVALSLALAWWRREVASLAPALLLALAGYLCVATQGRFHIYHFQTCHPFLSIFWAYACVKIWEGFSYVRRRCAQRRWAVAGALTWAVLGSLVYAMLSEEAVRTGQQYAFLLDYWNNTKLSYQNYYPQLPLEKLYEQLRVIDYVKQNSDPEDTVYVWGIAPLVNFLTARHSPTRFFYNYPLISTWGLPAWRQEVAQTLLSKRPRYIVVERNDDNPVFTNNILTSEQYLRLLQYPGLSNLLRDRYKPAVNYSDFEIYELTKNPAYSSEKPAPRCCPSRREEKTRIW